MTHGFLRLFGQIAQLLFRDVAYNVKHIFCTGQRNVQQTHFFFALFCFVKHSARRSAYRAAYAHGVKVVVIDCKPQFHVAFHRFGRQIKSAFRRRDNYYRKFQSFGSVHGHYSYRVGVTNALFHCVVVRFVDVFQKFVHAFGKS